MLKSPAKTIFSTDKFARYWVILFKIVKDAGGGIYSPTTAMGTLATTICIITNRPPGSRCKSISVKERDL